jgi:hypothetical protein
MSFSFNKSYLAPQADALSSNQLRFLLVNAPFSIILNNYKSKFVSLNTLRSLVISNNGFTYHPNKNVKTRAFREFNMVLSSDVLNGLVVFAFFNRYTDLNHFLTVLNSTPELNTISYFSLLSSGHIVTQAFLNQLAISHKTGLTSPATKLLFVCNKILFDNTFQVFNFSLNKINLILNAYIKSIN